MKYNYSEDIMGILREHAGLEPDDTSRDHLLTSLSPDQVFRNVCEYEIGDPAWAGHMKRWVTSIYDVKL